MTASPIEKPIRFEELRPNGRDWNRAWTLYENSFPARERRNAADHRSALADPLFHAEAILAGEDFAGLLYSWDAPGFAYVEHLAVDPALRGQDIGSRALKDFCDRRGQVVLEIDPPEDEISIRRLNFYRRLGFVANDRPYIHPSFSRPFDPHPLVLMSYPEALEPGQAETLERFVRDRVLRYSGHAKQ